MIKPRSSSHYDFTEDWFSFRAELWARFLSPLAGRPHLHFAEVGVFEGRSTIWLLEHVLTNRSSRIDCIDPFEWTSRHGPVSIDMAEVERRFHANIEAAAGGDRVRLIRARSQEALCRLDPGSYDFIYIDGSHLAEDVLTDAVLAFRLLKQGGLLAFDDYLLAEARGVEPSLDDPKAGIDAFLAVHAHRLELLWKDYQVIVRRTAKQGPSARPAAGRAR
jgi:predicted O-methyltransferase YrrM